MRSAKHLVIGRGDLRPAARTKPLDQVELLDLREEIFDMGMGAESVTIMDSTQAYIIKDNEGVRRWIEPRGNV